MPEFNIYVGSLQDRFQKSRSKIQFFGGGFANGKTANASIKTLTVAENYPGANILLARSTYPKLNDTLKKEFLKWCPPEWIKSQNKQDNVVILKNGTTINFRYIAQQGKSNESTTSNLLSATYDLIVVDQIEDPEIVYKDFLDLLGRLRGMARYVGNDPTMPKTGPRWLIITSNPTRNWVYKKIVYPLHQFQKTKRVTEDLIIDEETGLPLIELFEGSTYENKDNLEADFIKTLEATYTGQMKERYLLGLWAAYEGLVYPKFEESIHVVSDKDLERYMWDMIDQDIEFSFIEAYDYGLAVPACYLFGIVDHYGNVLLLDGFYEKELSIEKQAQLINKIRGEYGVDASNPVFADPAIFKRIANKKVARVTIADYFDQYGITMVRADNDIINGIAKMTSYIEPRKNHFHPIFGTTPAPYFYVSSKLEFFVDEINEYRWDTNTQGERLDKPVDKNDHAMDTAKYLLSRRPRVATINSHKNRKQKYLTSWVETDIPKRRKNHRYG